MGRDSVEGDSAQDRKDYRRGGIVEEVARSPRWGWAEMSAVWHVQNGWSGRTDAIICNWRGTGVVGEMVGGSG